MEVVVCGFASPWEMGMGWTGFNRVKHVVDLCAEPDKRVSLDEHDENNMKIELNTFKDLCTKELQGSMPYHMQTNRTMKCQTEISSRQTLPGALQAPPRTDPSKYEARGSGQFLTSNEIKSGSTKKAANTVRLVICSPISDGGAGVVVKLTEWSIAIVMYGRLTWGIHNPPRLMDTFIRNYQNSWQTSITSSCSTSTSTSNSNSGSFLRSKPIECAICKDEFIKGENIKRLPCRHFFHHECIRRWLSYKKNCSICRRTIVKPKVAIPRSMPQQSCGKVEWVEHKLPVVALFFYQMMDLYEAFFGSGSTSTYSLLKKARGDAIRSLVLRKPSIGLYACYYMEAYTRTGRLEMKIGIHKPPGLMETFIRNYQNSWQKSIAGSGSTSTSTSNSFLRSKPTECTICKDEFIKGENIKRLPCHHYFHHECIRRWLSYKKNCPICRRTIVKPKVAIPRSLPQQSCGKVEWVEHKQPVVALFFYQMMDLYEAFFGSGSMSTYSLI
ncbi:hypothetical protein LXL04_004077 [Taraxacum kok-saghyz]